MEPLLKKDHITIGGKTISVLSDDLLLLQKEKLKINEIYCNILKLYGEKLDRESIFLLMIFDIFHNENKKKAAEGLDELLLNLCNEIDSLNLI